MSLYFHLFNIFYHFTFPGFPFILIVCSYILSVLHLSEWMCVLQPNSEELDRRVEELRRHYQEARLKARGGGGTGGPGPQSGNNTPGGGSNSPNSPAHSRSRHSSPTRSSKDKHHNSVSPRWGGFISRNNHTSDKHRSRTQSRSLSHSPPPKHSKKSKKR